MLADIPALASDRVRLLYSSCRVAWVRCCVAVWLRTPPPKVCHGPAQSKCLEASPFLFKATKALPIDLDPSAFPLVCTIITTPSDLLRSDDKPDGQTTIALHSTWSWACRVRALPGRCHVSLASPPPWLPLTLYWARLALPTCSTRRHWHPSSAPFCTPPQLLQIF